MTHTTRLGKLERGRGEALTTLESWRREGDLVVRYGGGLTLDGPGFAAHQRRLAATAMVVVVSVIDTREQALALGHA